MTPAADGGPAAAWRPPGEMPLVHAGQTLRLCLRQCIPTEVVAGQWFPVSVGCRNEFGLWKRDEFPVVSPTDAEGAAAGAVPLGLELVELSGEKLEVEIDTEGPTAMDSSGKLDFTARLRWQLEVPSMAMLRIFVKDEGEGRLLRPLLPVWSPPLCLGEGRGLPDPGRLTLEQMRCTEVHEALPSLLCAECQGDLGIGGRVWDGALVLMEYLVQQRPLRGRYLELGSGTGLVGMSCALLGAQVLLTDLPEVTPLLTYNVALNRARGVELKDVEVLPHQWGTAIDDLDASSVDVVVMADVVYDVEASQQLLVSLLALAEANAALQFIMAFRPRNVEDPEFFNALSEYFEMTPEKSTGFYGKMCYDLQILRLQRKTKTASGDPNTG